MSSFLSEDKSDEAENLPSMETLEISSKNKTVKSIPSHFGDPDEEDIPDMADYEEPDNIETDAVSFYICVTCNVLVLNYACRHICERLKPHG